MMSSVSNRCRIALFSGLLLAYPGRAQAPATEPISLSAAHGRLTAAVASGVIPGAGLWVVGPETGPREQYFGRYHATTRIPIDTSSQWLATATVLSLLDSGDMSLSDPLIRFFPDVGDDKAAITLRQLLSHTSALQAQHPCVAQSGWSLAQCTEEILAAPLNGEPGDDFRIGSAAYQVAGRIAEIIADASWEEIFQNRLATPLGMTGTTFGDSPNPRVGSGATTNLGDYGKFLQEILAAMEGQGKVLSPEMATEMLTAIEIEGLATDQNQGKVFALGCWVEPDPEGSESYSHPGVFGFTPWLDPTRRQAGVLLLLAEPRRGQKLAAEVRAQLKGPPQGPKTEPPDETENSDEAESSGNTEISGKTESTDEAGAP